MNVLALTLLSLAALSQAGRLSYKLQCTRDEVGIRWPSYHSNSEYFVCQGVYGGMLTVHCSAGEVFSFVLQQCSKPALFVPPPPIGILPTGAPITVQRAEEEPPVIGKGNTDNNNIHTAVEHVGHHVAAEHKPEPAHLPEPQSPVINEPMPTPPTPPTSAPEPATPPTLLSNPAAAIPVPAKANNKPSVPSVTSTVKKPTVPVPSKAASVKKPATTVTAPKKASKQPTPPKASKAVKAPKAPKKQTA